jgi:hypothetical protein
MGVGAGVITGGPTASDPTSSLPLPPAATRCLPFGWGFQRQLCFGHPDDQPTFSKVGERKRK